MAVKIDSEMNFHVDGVHVGHLKKREEIAGYPEYCIYGYYEGESYALWSVEGLGMAKKFVRESLSTKEDFMRNLDYLTVCFSIYKTKEKRKEMIDTYILKNWGS